MIRERPRLLVAGHLPPPVHGMSVATLEFVKILTAEADKAGFKLKICRISADPNRSSILHHLQRIGRVFMAAIAILWNRDSLRSLYVSADADVGMIYTTVLCGAARMCGVKAYVHHHSASYLGEIPKRRVQALCWVAGPLAHHLIACLDAQARFEHAYPGAVVDLIPMWFAIDDHPVPHRRGRPTAGSIRLGHMGNLSLEKGLEEVFRSADRLTKFGMSPALVLAGPRSSSREVTFIDEQINLTGYEVEYRGPVFGQDRERFFDDIDVFLFPSLYRHEYTPLVLGEALSRGIPIVARETICCRKGIFDRAGLVLASDAEFATECVKWIEERLFEDRAWKSLLDGVREFKGEINAARDRAHEMAKEIFQIRPG